MGRSYELLRDNSIGSGDDCRIQLSDDAIFAGGALIQRRERGRYVLGADGALNVNGQDIEQDTLLQHGDLIMLGKTLLLFDDEKDRLRESSEQDITTQDMLDSQIDERQSYYESADRVIETLGELDRPHTRLITLYKVANAISGILDLQTLLNMVLDLLFEEFKPDRGFIMLMDRGNRKLKPMATRVVRGICDDHPRIPKAIVKEVLVSKDSILCKNAMTDSRFMTGDTVVGQQIHSALSAPLIHNGEILGLIHLDCQARSEVYGKQDLDHLTKIAMQASVAIHNARIVRRSQQFSRKLLSLGSVTQQLSSYLRKDLIVRETAQAACRVFGCTKCSVFLLDSQSEELYLAYSIGLERSKWADIRHKFGEGICGWVASRGEPLRVRSARQVPAEIGFDQKDRYQTSSFLVVPMISPVEEESKVGAVSGVICVTDKVQGEPFYRVDQELLMILAGYMASALSNARYCQELKDREEQIQLMNRELERRVEERTAELAAARDQLVQSEKMAAVGLLAAGVSHEFNNLVTSMFGFAQIAKEQPQYQEKLVNIVLSQSERARDITDNLLSFSRQSSVQLELSSLPNLMDEVLGIIGKALANESIEVIKHYRDVPDTVVVPGKIHQLFLNLIINARDAIERDGAITIEFEQSGDWIILRVKDTGKGIPPENIRRVFEPFFTTKGSFGGSQQPGTGVGLSVCYNLIQEHGGEIRVESEVGVGSTFTVQLPLCIEVPASTTEIERRPTERMRKIPRRRIVLVVDDDQPIREILERILVEKEYRVVAVSNAVEAIEVCKKERIDCVFLDIKMPGKMDGYAAFDEIRRIDNAIRVILITGQAEDEKLQGYVKQADGYVRKPFKVQAIYEYLDV